MEQEQQENQDPRIELAIAKKQEIHEELERLGLTQNSDPEKVSEVMFRVLEDWETETNYVPVTDEEIKTYAHGIVTNTHYCSVQCPPDLHTQVFMILGLVNEATRLDLIKLRMVFCISEMSKAMSMGVNGYPVFMETRLLTAEDGKKIVDKATQIQEFLEKL